MKHSREKEGMEKGWAWAWQGEGRGASLERSHHGQVVPRLGRRAGAEAKAREIFRRPSRGDKQLEGTVQWQYGRRLHGSGERARGDECGGLPPTAAHNAACGAAVAAKIISGRRVEGGLGLGRGWVSLGSDGRKTSGDPLAREAGRSAAAVGQGGKHAWGEPL